MNAFRKKIAGAAVGGSLLLGGAAAVIAQSGAASAADTTTTSTAASTDTSVAAAAPTAPVNAPDPSKGGHTANGITEVVMTGDAAAQANAAALAAVPGATVDRVENDAEGATYEAHMTKADGSRVTVKFDASFNVTSIEVGMK
jgi:uncharacterized membrane protein YkoI